ncbi:S8 family serine peptidase [Kutzneria sp. 744]|uniref:S8 family peptidase n=1 Tax=Kutzneria sp. (strain 744) TaxID=345341 RepID=UPI0003EEC79B|nr:S8 family serine peptidase [Kutzneria sp. 744]EWM14225.1 peptidase, S8/S53 [Kutzneria sp. 744]
MKRSRLLTVATTMTMSAALALLGNGPAQAAPLAPATDGAADGGRVIVVLGNQHSDLKLRAQSSQRTNTTHNDQQSVVTDIKANGGTDVTQLVSVNAIAAKLSSAEVNRLRANPAVREIVPDEQMTRTAPAKVPQAKPARLSSKLCPSDPAKPFLEPEALAVDKVETDRPGDTEQASKIATGKGVLVAVDGMNELAGNPNFVRPDGSHVVIDAPDPTEDDSDGEYYGDASSVAGQGLVTYDYSKELPYSGLPTGCTFRIKGVAPDASLVDSRLIDTPPSASGDIQLESQVVAGIDRAVVLEHADVISESYGYTPRPGRYSVFYAANDAAVAAGVTVVVSSGDSGVSGTVSSPATDPLVIAVGATNTLRLTAQAYGYDDWINNDITPLSSGGTAPNNRVVDLVAPGYGGEAACSPIGSDCPTNTLTEAFGGTSQSCPLVAGAVADVIQAYADTHNGVKPTPALIKQILTGTAKDVGAPADQQGAGLLDVYAAVRAAQQAPGSTSGAPEAPALVPSPSQLDVTANAGASAQTVNLYNASSTPTTVTGTYRELGAAKQFGTTVTEPVSAPGPSLPVPAYGATAASPITFTVPKGLDRLSVDMITPDPTNGTILSFTLVDPKGRLSQISYDYGTPPSGSAKFGSVPNIQHVEVAAPAAGQWTAKILWANGRAHLQSPPNVPGSYRGTISFRTMGQHYVTKKATDAVTIPAHTGVDVPLSVDMPTAPGDHPESVQFVAANGAHTSLPIQRRTLIPSTGGKFTGTITSTVGRQVGQISTFDIDVPAGKKDLDVNFHTADASADNGLTYYLIDPDGKVVTTDSSPTTTVQGVGSDKPIADAALVTANPKPGRWEIDVMLKLTVSGLEFTQQIAGTVGYDRSDAFAYNLPAAGSTVSATSSRQLFFRVTNTTGIGRTLRLTSTAGDITFGAPTYLAAGTSALFTATLKPVAAAGTVVSGAVNVLSNTSVAGGSQTLAVLPYGYTVGTTVNP